MRKLQWEPEHKRVVAVDEEGASVVMLDLVFAKLTDDETALLEEMVYAWNEAHR